MEEKIWFVSDEWRRRSDEVSELDFGTSSELAMYLCLILWDGATRRQLRRLFKPLTLSRTLKSLADKGIIYGR